MPSAPGMNNAKSNSAVGIAGVIIETPCYSSGSQIGLRLSLIVNVLFLP